MSHFDDSLRDTLRRTEPPDGFADRVMERIRRESAAQAPVVSSAALRAVWRSRWVPAAIAAALLLSLGGWRYHEFRQGVKAKEQLLVALDITSTKLSFASRKVDELSQRTIQ